MLPPVTKEEPTKSSRAIALAFGVLAVAALSCDTAMLVPGARTFPTSAPGVFETIVAGTAGAAQTQTAVLLPATPTQTLTPTVTRTPTLTPTFTPTFIWKLRTATPPHTATPTLGATTGQLACKLVGQDPDDGTRMAPNTDFDAVWEVRNTGASAWAEDAIDFAYVSGRKMHKKALYDLPGDVNKGETVNLVVDMVAPKDPGRYSTEWTLRRGGQDFCHVDLTIVVK